MKKSRFTDSQIIAVKQGSESTFSKNRGQSRLFQSPGRLRLSELVAEI